MSEFAEEDISIWYDKHSKAVLNFILLMVKDYQVAEDLTHDTFVKAYIYHNSFKGNASEKTWLFSIAHNVTVDYLRKRKPLLQLKEVFLSKADPKLLPEEVVQVRQESYELYKVLAEMKDAYKKVIILRKIQGFSTEDTASILHWSESKVKSTLHRALPLLKKKLIMEGYLYEKSV